MPYKDDIWDSAAEEQHWREELEIMRHGATAIEQKADLNTTDFYITVIGGLDAANQFVKPEYFVSRATFVAEIRRLLLQPTAPSRPVSSVEQYQRTQRRWLESVINRYAPKMKFRSVHVNQEDYYSLGVDEQTNSYVLQVTITWVAWYSRYFKLSKAELEDYPSNRVMIDGLARSCMGPAGIANNRERFLYSEKSEENLD